jgi:predicted O-methyltransferase YrrM
VTGYRESVAARRPSRRTTFARAWLTAAAGTASALLLALPRRSARRSVIRLARELGYDHRPPPHPVLPVVDVETVIGEHPLRLRAPVAVDGNVTLLELVVLASLVAARRPLQVFEIGTFDGRTTINLAANAPEGAVVHTLDLPPTGSPALGVHEDDLQFIDRARRGARGGRIRGTPEAARIRQLESDSATFDYSPYAASMDFVFVDGSHAYEYVVADSRSAISMAAPGALIAWHDYGEWPGVTRALNELPAVDARFRGIRHVSGTTLALLEV